MHALVVDVSSVVQLHFGLELSIGTLRRSGSASHNCGASVSSSVDSTAFAAFTVVWTPPGIGSHSACSSHRGRCVNLPCCWLSLSSATNIVYIIA